MIPARSEIPMQSRKLGTEITDVAASKMLLKIEVVIVKASLKFFVQCLVLFQVLPLRDLSLYVSWLFSKQMSDIERETSTVRSRAHSESFSNHESYLEQESGMERS